MAKCWYFFLCCKYLIAYTTMTSFGKSGLCTGWLYRIIYNNRMSCCLDFFCSCIAASLTCKCLNSCLCTCWGRCYLSSIPCVAKSRYFFLYLNGLITYTTMTSCCKSWLCTSWCYRLVINCCMACCFDSFCSCITTNLTCKCLNSCLCTCWCCCYLSVIPCMSEHWYFFLYLNGLITYTTMTSCCKSCFRTGWIYRIIYNNCMACCLYFFCSCFTTSLTCECLDS